MPALQANTYKSNYSYVLEKKKQYSDPNSYIELSMQEALDLLKNFVDPSDPDVDFGNDIHNYQTAERCRQLLSDQDWFHLIGLIHDVGKILYMFGEPTWAIVGDTFPVCHPFSRSCIYYDFFKQNLDFKNRLYTKTIAGLKTCTFHEGV